MRYGIGIGYSGIWQKSRRLIVTALKAMGNDYYNDDNPAVLLNIGGDCRNATYRILNKKTSHVRDKITMNYILNDYDIRHPNTWFYPFSRIPNTNAECVVKNRYGQRGRGIIFTTFDRTKKMTLTDLYYIQQYIPFAREFRVGVDFKRVLGIREKMGDAKIRNSRTCEYITRKIPELKEFAWNISRKFSMDLCGIDIGEYLGKYYIIELNSAPTIGEAWARKLANDMVSLL